MKNDALQNLIIRADDASPSPALVANLAEQVRRKSRRRRRWRAAVSAFAVTATCIMSFALLRQPDAPLQLTRATPAEVQQIKAEIAALETSALVHERTARALRQAQASARQRYADLDGLVQFGALQRVDEARDRAALLLLREAERAASRPQNVSAVRESFGRAARLFPETPAGRVAAERLALLL